MKKSALLLALLFTALFKIQAQVGHTTITFADASRTGGFGSGGGAGRQIQTEIYYPAATTGDNVPVLGGNYPVIVFGHGFVMVWSAYQNIWEALVAQGYIVAFPRTEGSISPSHGDFGLDLAYVAEAIQTRGTSDASFFFYQKTAPTTAIMGHSMGGGAALLASQNNSNITAMAVLAAAETNPSAVAAAPGINVPSLIFAGGNDCVTPPGTNQIPMYNALASQCKTLVTITGGSHCQFSDDNFNCNFGEATCSPSPTISRSQQHTTLELYLIPFLNKYLKGTCSPNSNFDALLAIGTGITYQQNCVTQAGNAITACSGNAVTLGSTIMDGYTFNWTSTPVGFASTLATPSITAQNTTTYILNYTNLQSNCSVVDSVTVTVNPTPIAIAGNSTTICTNNTLPLGNTPANNVNYSWAPGTNLSDATVANPLFTPTNAGTNQYILTATGTQGGCIAKDTVDVTVLDAPLLSVLSNQTLCPGAPAQLGVTLTPFVPATIAAAQGSVSIPDNSPGGGVVANNTLPTAVQLAGRANKTVTIPTGSYTFTGINLSINHPYNQDLDIYLVAPNSQVFLISTDNGGNGNGYTNVSFNDAAATVPPTANTTFTNVSYKPEGAPFITYIGAVSGVWTLYVVDDGLFDTGSITDFKVNVLELPTGLTYQWLPANGLNDATIVNPIATATQNYTYTAQVNYLGCSVADSVAINRLTLPVVNAGTDVTSCQQAPVLLGEPPVNGFSYAWLSNPAGTNESTAQISVSPTTTTSYILTVVDANTCQNTDTVTVTVGTPVAPVITAQGPTTFCFGGSVQLSTDLGSNFVWLPGQTTTPVITVNDGGTYGLVAGIGTACVDTAFITVTVNPNPSLQFTADYNLCPGDSVQLAGIAGYDAYAWAPNGEQTLDIIANAPGLYQQTATDSNGCQGVVASANIIYYPQNTTGIAQNGDSLLATPTQPGWQYQWYFNNQPIANSNTPYYIAQGDGNYYVAVIDGNGCAFQSEEYNYIKGNVALNAAGLNNLYPNPATSNLMLQFSLPTTATVTLTDALGRLVFTQLLTNTTQHQLDVAGLSKGLYLLHIQKGNSMSTFKIIKQ